MSFASVRAGLITGNSRDIAGALVGMSLWRCFGIAVRCTARDSSSPGRRLELPPPATKIASPRERQVQRACIWSCEAPSFTYESDMLSDS